MLATNDPFRYFLPLRFTRARRAFSGILLLVVTFSVQDSSGQNLSLSINQDANRSDRIARSTTVNPDEPPVIAPAAVNPATALLIDQLDADSFLARERATENLASLGESALGPLARKSFDCTPETCWRIRKTMEEICVHGDESVLYKTAGILRIRFHGQDASISDRLVKLESRWRQQRQDDAIRKLRSLGASIDYPSNSSSVAAIPGPVFNPGIRLMIEAGTEKETPRRQVGKSDHYDLNQDESEARQKQMSQIDAILTSSLEENRRFVFGNHGEVPDSAKASQGHLMNNAVFINRFGEFQSNRINDLRVQFTEAWTGKMSDLNTLKDIDRLGQISFSDQAMTLDVLDFVADLDMVRRLEFSRCEIKLEDLEQLDWSPSLEEFSLSDHLITAELLSALGRIPSLQTLTMVRCKIEDDAFSKLETLKSLSGLILQESIISSSTFEKLGQLESISYVSLNFCKFRTTDFRRLQKERPGLRINFSAQAFLGVRSIPGNAFGLQGERDIERGGCEITEVIDPSGAHDAGMMVGDIIETIDGDSIDTFDDLRLQIAQHMAGDELDVQVSREGKKLMLQVKLGKMDTAPVR